MNSLTVLISYRKELKKAKKKSKWRKSGKSHKILKDIWKTEVLNTAHIMFFTIYYKTIPQQLKTDENYQLK